MSSVNVKDIRTFSSINNSRPYFVDTNALYWYTYPRYNLGRCNHDAQIYFDFLDNLVSAGNPLYTSIYNVTELLNIIEKKEHEIYQTIHPEYSKKDLRKMKAQRESLKQQMLVTLNNVSASFKVINFQFSMEKISDFICNLSSHRCDIFDYLVLDNCLKEGNLNIITDDNDFSSISGITLYTANESILNP